MPGLSNMLRYLQWLFGLFLIEGLLVVSMAAAADRTNVPLKNWGGFSVFRDAAYDDLERLVTAGLADRTLLSTKPLSRLEAARIVARAIETIRRDDGALNRRRDLEPLLDRLMDEFKVELASLGVPISQSATETPPFASFVPVDRAQVFGGYSNHRLALVNNQGLAFRQGANGGATLESRAQIGDFLSFYLQPELLGNEDFGAARLATGYAKLTLFNVELLVGRDSLWWGPGLRGSTLLSNNAAPLDQVRIGAAEPFLLPWIGRWVGPTKLLFFVAQLEERRDHPRAKLSGMRVAFSPVSFFEFGASRTILFDGDDKPRLRAENYPRALFQPEAGDIHTGKDMEFRNDNLFGIDGDLRLSDVDRYYLPARDLRLYGEFYWDDTCCNSNIVPKRAAIGGLAGATLFGLFGQEGLDARFEYAASSILSYAHDQFASGYWTRGHVISHFMGTEGKDIYARLTKRLTPNLMLGLELDRAVIGSTAHILPKERRTGAGIDLSYRFWERYSIFAQYLVSDVENRGFRAGDDGFDHLVRLELTRSFR